MLLSASLALELSEELDKSAEEDEGTPASSSSTTVKKSSVTERNKYSCIIILKIQVFLADQEPVCMLELNQRDPSAAVVAVANIP